MQAIMVEVSNVDTDAPQKLPGWCANRWSQSLRSGSAPWGAQSRFSSDEVADSRPRAMRQVRPRQLGRGENTRGRKAATAPSAHPD